MVLQQDFNTGFANTKLFGMLTEIKPLSGGLISQRIDD